MDGLACCIKVVAWATVDDDGVGGEYVLPFIPLVEVAPVVCADDEAELVLWICFGEFAEGVDHVGWDGQAVLEVGNSDAVHPFSGETGDVQTLGVVKDVGIG